MTIAELDCTSQLTALNSSAALLNRRPQALRKALLAYSTEQLVADQRFESLTDEELLVRWVLRNRSCPVPPLVRWFHATRVFSDNSIAREGIRPLNEMSEQLKVRLQDMASKAGIRRRAYPESVSTGHPGAYHFFLKTSNREHHGPFAFLTRDAIVRRSDITWDYLSTPEIVYDLAFMMFDQAATDVLEVFRTSTERTIVHFRSPNERDDVLPKALLYLYRLFHSGGSEAGTHTCYDGEGKAVPPANILMIEPIRT